jgi:hypothetical protein
LARQRDCASCTCIIETSTSARRALCNWPVNVGKATLDSTPAIESTTSISIIVKPRVLRLGHVNGMSIPFEVQQAR